MGWIEDIASTIRHPLVDWRRCLPLSYLSSVRSELTRDAQSLIAIGIAFDYAPMFRASRRWKMRRASPNCDGCR